MIEIENIKNKKASKLIWSTLTFGLILVVLLSSISCTTHRAKRLKNKSLRQWDPEKWNEEEKQSNPDKDSSLQINQTSELSFANAFETMNLDSIKNQNSVGDLLEEDFLRLFDFSKTNYSIGITEKSFLELFWEGVATSLNFYQSSETISHTTINHLIANEIAGRTALNLIIEKPENIETSLSKSYNALNQFSGEWHGYWESMKVHHLWLPLRAIKSKLTYNYSLMGFQSCHTGDGFGWNYVVKEKDKTIILGFVCHLNDSGEISVKNPHYAYLNTNNQLTWISEDHVYYEFVDENSKGEKQYIITGGKYENQISHLQLAFGFQAIYLTEDQELPSFQFL